MEQLAKLWWQNITGPQDILSRIISVLKENKHVLLSNFLTAPWKEYLRSHCNALLSSIYRDINIEILDAKNIPSTEIGKYLLENYCRNKAIRNAYRPNSQRTLGNYLIENKVLLNKILWVKGICWKNLDDWINFSNNYVAKQIGDGLFVLEVDENYAAPGRKNLSVIDYQSVVREYDHYTFICQLLSKKSQSLTLAEVKYVAAVTFGLCRRNIESAVSFLDKTPRSILIAETDDLIKDSHFKDLPEQEIKNRLWLLQVQELFPLLETQRICLLEKYHEEFQNLWDFDVKVRMNQQGQVRETIDEFEIGEMDYYVATQRVWMPDKTDRDKINTLHTVRNKLAHHNLCTRQEVCFMLTLNNEQ